MIHSYQLFYEEVDIMKTLPLEMDHKIKLPRAWVRELGLESGVMLERTDEGILIRAYTAQTWDEIYAEKLKMGTPSALDLSEVSGDDLIF